VKTLLIDDDPRVITLLSKALYRENCTVDTASDGESAFEKAKSNVYDVIVLDLMLPKKNGEEFISSLRALGNNVPILVISAKPLVEDRVNVLNLGADDYLVKNFSLSEFVARVKVLMRRRINRRSNIFRCRDLTVNFSDLSVARRGQSIDLSRKEFGILSELIKHKNEVVTREKIIDSVWGEHDVEIFSNTVDVHIRSLRQKIDNGFDDDEGSLIETKRGYGYIMRDSVEVVE
jgi:DNA-binding response OmpR family regulator